jgi:hypothetical protein
VEAAAGEAVRGVSEAGEHLSAAGEAASSFFYPKSLGEFFINLAGHEKVILKYPVTTSVE